MITHKQKSKGGEFTVHSPQEDTVVEYVLSNCVGSVLCLRCFVHKGNSKNALGVLSAVCEKYNPSVMIVNTSIQEVLFNKRINEMYRHETINKSSLYAGVGENRELICKMWKNSSSLNSKENCTNDIRILKTIREQTTPFEFVLVKEEYDYIRREHCRSTVFEILEISRLFSPNDDFSNNTKYLSKKINKDLHFYESNSESVLQCVEEIIIPAIIIMGSVHSFPIKLIESLGKCIKNYSDKKEEFLSRFDSV